MRESTFVHLTITDETSLAAAYMPFVRGGGLFIKTDKSIVMGAEIQLSLHLFEDPQDISIRGKVVWVNPAHGADKGSSTNKVRGIGIRLPESMKQLKLRIENLLPDCDELPTRSFTL